MGARGPAPKPSDLKKKQGTYQKSKSLSDEFSPEKIINLPKAPVFLNKFGKQEYYKVGEVLLKNGLLADIDMNTFISYCMQMGVYYDSQMILKKEGRVIKSKSGYMQPHPYVAIGNAAHALALKIGASFGITPSARTRVSAPKQDVKTSKLLSLIPKKANGA